MNERKPIPAKLLQRIKTVTNKRARFVLDSIVKNGSVSTIQLKDAGYDHPPRAARDAVELGFALTRIKAKRDDGQAIAAYVFDERELDHKLTGRVVLAKKERDASSSARAPNVIYAELHTTSRLTIVSRSWLLANLSAMKQTRINCSTARATGRNRGVVSIARIG